MCSQYLTEASPTIAHCLYHAGPGVQGAWQASSLAQCRSQSTGTRSNNGGWCDLPHYAGEPARSMGRATVGFQPTRGRKQLEDIAMTVINDGRF